jgi:hypothetical protein
MGLLSRIQSGGKMAAELWRRGDLASVPLGPSEHAVRLRGREPFVAWSFVVEFVYGCEEFRPLEAHIADYAETHAWGAAEIDTLRQQLPALMESGALVSTRMLRAAAERSPPEPPPPAMETLGISTGGDRWELLHHCLASFHENVRAHGRTAELLVSENSADPAQTARTREALAAWAGKSGAHVRVAGAEEKRALLEHLVRAGACSLDLGEFALFDPLQTRFSVGANRNFLLLHEAGRVFGSLDDDVFCRLSAPPEKASEELSFFSDGDPFSRWLFADRAAAQAFAGASDADYVGVHAALLGRTVGDALRSAPGADFTDAQDFLARRMVRQPPRVRATFLGHVGDPGIPTSAYYLYYRRENWRRLVAGEAHYHGVFPSRSVMSIVPQPRIGDASVSPGMAMGIDHRTLVPPFFPVLHAEDFSWGAALWHCCPDAVLGHLPYAIAHEPPEGKTILTPADLRAQPPFLIWEFAHLLRRLILQTGLPIVASAERRMLLLGRALRDIGELPPADFLELVRQQALAEASERLEYLHREISHAQDPPDFWLQDVEGLIEHLRASISAPGAEIPLDLQSTRPPAATRAFMQTVTGRYGELLQAWPAMVETARGVYR